MLTTTPEPASAAPLDPPELDELLEDEELFEDAAVEAPLLELEELELVDPVLEAADAEAPKLPPALEDELELAEDELPSQPLDPAPVVSPPGEEDAAEEDAVAVVDSVPEVVVLADSVPEPLLPVTVDATVPVAPDEALLDPEAVAAEPLPEDPAVEEPLTELGRPDVVPTVVAAAVLPVPEVEAVEFDEVPVVFETAGG